MIPSRPASVQLRQAAPSRRLTEGGWGGQGEAGGWSVGVRGRGRVEREAGRVKSGSGEERMWSDGRVWWKSGKKGTGRVKSGCEEDMECRCGGLVEE